MLVVGLRRAEAAKRINRSRQAGHGGLQGLQSNYPITPWWTGRITLIYRRHDAQQPPLPSARAQRRSEGGWFVDSCNKVIDLPRGDVSMRAQLALRVELSKVCASFLPVSIDLHAKGFCIFRKRWKIDLIFDFCFQPMNIYLQWFFEEVYIRGLCDLSLDNFYKFDLCWWKLVTFTISYGSQGVKTITRILVYTCNLWME